VEKNAFPSSASSPSTSHNRSRFSPLFHFAQRFGAAPLGALQGSN
jgi:hypothetical protein